MLVSGVTYVAIEIVRAASPATPFYLSGGLYPGGPDYTIFREGSDYFAKDENGQIEFDGSNATTVINNAIGGLPTGTVQLPNPAGSPRTVPYGTILIKAGQYGITAPIQVPLGSRIMIYGEGTGQQMIGNGGTLGTIITNSGDTPAFEALSVSGAVTSSGTMLVMEGIEFIQSVNLSTVNTPAVDLSGMSQGIVENVQVHKGYGANLPMRQGVGIECVQEIGGDHAGGPTLWRQIGVMGFTNGINGSMTIFKGTQIDIANCTTALYWENHLETRLEGLHIFQCERILALYGGFTTYGQIVIDGLYLENCGGGVGGYEWYVDSGFHGYLRIYNTNVNVGLAATLWRCNDNESIWFEDMMVTGGAPGFPTVATPGTTSGVAYVNENMQLVEVYVSWTTVDNVTINNDVITTANDEETTFFLRPGDFIAIHGTFSWHWREYSADRGHQDDV